MSKWKDKTRGGSDVRIYSESGANGLPIHGAVHRNLGWCVAGWDKSGRFWGGIRPEDDLIPNTPDIDWSKQPAWCKAVAMDYDSVWRRFAGKPYLSGNLWFSSDCFRQQMHPSEYPDWDGDWKDSLCVRPEGDPK